VTLISFFYLIIILIYLAIGAAIVFHVFYYKINRQLAVIMFFIYFIGSLLFLISNYSLFQSVNWNNIFFNAGF